VELKDIKLSLFIADREVRAEDPVSAHLCLKQCAMLIFNYFMDEIDSFPILVTFFSFRFVGFQCTDER
jgi:hypothetical protein